MKTITLNIPDPLYARIMQEVDHIGFGGKTDFFRFLAINYFLQNKKKESSIEDDLIKAYEPDIIASLSGYLKNPKNIARVIHIED